MCFNDKCLRHRLNNPTTLTFDPGSIWTDVLHNWNGIALPTFWQHCWQTDRKQHEEWLKIKPWWWGLLSSNVCKVMTNKYRRKTQNVVQTWATLSVSTTEQNKWTGLRIASICLSIQLILKTMSAAVSSFKQTPQLLTHVTLHYITHMISHCRSQ